MANEIGAARGGLKTALEGIPGLRVYDHPPNAVNQLPTVFLHFTGRGHGLTLSGSSFRGRLTATVLVSRGKGVDGHNELTQYLDPLGTNSIEARVDSDNTWGGSVDHGQVVTSGNVREMEIGGGRYLAADFECEFVKGVVA